LRPEPEAWKRARKRSAVAEYRGQYGVRRRCPGAADGGDCARQFDVLGSAGLFAVFVDGLFAFAGLLAAAVAGAFSAGGAAAIAARTSSAR
jgi:hypothetical protein